jgi:hypothetical protein
MIIKAQTRTYSYRKVHSTVFTFKKDKWYVIIFESSSLFFL